MDVQLRKRSLATSSMTVVPVPLAELERPMLMLSLMVLVVGKSVR